MNADIAWCHDCDLPVPDTAAFYWHANRGHAITDGRCPSICQFQPLPFARADMVAVAP